jgi:uncharacterized SAM-binding protein YcdF (DUF218 family)
MFFYLSKVLGFVTVPSNLLIFTGLFGLLLTATRWRRAGMRLMGAALLLLAVAGYSPLANLLIEPLEDRFPPWNASRGAPDGIIVLGGAINPEVSAARGAPQLNEAAERITAGVELARRYPSAKLVYSGGSANMIFINAMEADQALTLMLGLGVPRERLVIERRSRTTAENAVYSKQLLRPQPEQRWLLVTSAAHMPRAIGVFRKAGFAVEAYPVDWRTRGPGDLVPFNVLSGGLARLDTAAHEWIGLLAYWLAGKTSELLPSPEPPLSRGAAGPGDNRP